MKKAILILGLVSALMIPTVANAKTVCVKETKITKNFLKKHKKDTIYTYCHGILTKRNGDGIGKCGGYIKFHKGKVGQKYTLLLRYRKGTVEVDDIVDRIDFKGWKKPFSH